MTIHQEQCSESHIGTIKPFINSLRHTVSEWKFIFYTSPVNDYLVKVHRDIAQLGGTRNTYEGDVDKSTGEITYGDHARVGGTHNDRKLNKN